LVWFVINVADNSILFDNGTATEDEFSGEEAGLVEDHHFPNLHCLIEDIVALKGTSFVKRGW